jgi:hypothetical protein
MNSAPALSCNKLDRTRLRRIGKNSVCCHGINSTRKHSRDLRAVAVTSERRCRFLVDIFSFPFVFVARLFLIAEGETRNVICPLLSHSRRDGLTSGRIITTHVVDTPAFVKRTRVLVRQEALICFQITKCYPGICQSL